MRSSKWARTSNNSNWETSSQCHSMSHAEDASTGQLGGSGACKRAGWECCGLNVQRSALSLAETDAPCSALLLPDVVLSCFVSRHQTTQACLHQHGDIGAGAVYGLPTMGKFKGGQSEYHFVPSEKQRRTLELAMPLHARGYALLTDRLTDCVFCCCLSVLPCFLCCRYADFQLLALPKDRALSKMTQGLAFLSDVFPTGFHAAVSAGVGVGSIVYIAGAGPVGLCAAQSCVLLGASAVFIADHHADRLKLAETIGCKSQKNKQQMRQQAVRALNQNCA